MHTQITSSFCLYNFHKGRIRYRYYIVIAMAIYKKTNKYKQRLFGNDLKALLYAYGDSSSPNAETIQTVEDLLTCYLVDLVVDANKVRLIRGNNKLSVDDIMFALRNDPVKLGRVYDLKEMDRQIMMAKKMFGDDDVDKSSKIKDGSEITKVSDSNSLKSKNGSKL